ncbi:GAF domain-containing protein [Anaeromyxobacter dehalogenans]|uniref:Putative GAF sensor protein n=1 Tax=Anaeromyxobacter dehalogenans (strain 2CP-C) TaxID=290397 RepID=Q2IN18_ANADE|nr:GAF domain-containing protein [Anaeromyxobacter dehalogenans]ABC80204.1 putative GAF sensor protein [Anaeromyxobacter dehalogenans 2CP-C]
MRSHDARAAAMGGTGHAGGVIHVPAVADEPSPAPADLASLTQAQRAERALAEGRREREIPIERAFLQAALDFRQTLRVLVSAVVPKFADWCFVDLIDGDGIPRRVEVAHGDPAKAPLAQEMRSIAFGPGWATPGAQTIRDRAPRLFRQVTTEVMEWATHGERHLAVLRAIKPNSLLSVPLVARDRVIGSITLIRSNMLPGLDEADMVFAEALAEPAALALDNARWYQAEKAGRGAALEEADRERHDRVEAQRGVLRLRRIESVSASLASVLAPQAIARVAVENGLSVLEPATAMVVRAAPGASVLEVLHCQGWADDLTIDLRELRADAPALLAEAYRIQTAIWVSSPEALAHSYPNAAELALRVGDRAWAAVPLRCDGRTVGALGLGFPHPRDLDADEKRFVLTVAQIVAQALERARLRDEAR